MAKLESIGFRTTKAIRAVLEEAAAQRGITLSAAINLAVTTQYGAAHKSTRSRRRKAA